MYLGLTLLLEIYGTVCLVTFYGKRKKSPFFVRDGWNGYRLDDALHEEEGEIGSGQIVMEKGTTILPK